MTSTAAILTSTTTSAASTPTNPSAPQKIGGWFDENDLNTDATNWKSAIDSITKPARQENFYVLLNTNPASRSTLFNNMDQMFNYCRKKGILISLRFFYKDGEPDMSIIKQDVPQIADFLKNYTDVIYVIQAGFLGRAWGEWWGSKLTPDSDFGKNPTVRAAKTFVVDTLLTTGLPVALRYPRDIANYYDGHPQVTWHDDCILADGVGKNDVGTFDKGSVLWPNNDLVSAQNYAKSVPGPKGGESCDAGKHKATCEELLQFVKDYKLSYLNYGYPSNVYQIFKSNSACMQEITAALAANSPA